MKLFKYKNLFYSISALIIIIAIIMSISGVTRFDTDLKNATQLKITCGTEVSLEDFNDLMKQYQVDDKKVESVKDDPNSVLISFVLPPGGNMDNLVNHLMMFTLEQYPDSEITSQTFSSYPAIVSNTIYMTLAVLLFMIISWIGYAMVFSSKYGLVNSLALLIESALIVSIALIAQLKINSMVIAIILAICGISTILNAVYLNQIRNNFKQKVVKGNDKQMIFALSYKDTIRTIILIHVILLIVGVSLIVASGSAMNLAIIYSIGIIVMGFSWALIRPCLMLNVDGPKIVIR